MRYQTTRRSSVTDRLERERAKRKQRDMMFMGLLAFGALMLLLVIEMGRAYFAMQEVGTFADNINKMPPAEVKREVQRFADKLADHNPLVRNSAISAMKLATGWRLGPSPAEWRSWWDQHRDTWVYRGGKPAPAGSLTDQSVPWKDLVPQQLIQTSPAAAGVTNN